MTDKHSIPLSLLRMRINKSKIGVFLLLLGAQLSAKSQFTLVGRDHVMQLSGWFTPVYNYRLYNPNLPSNTLDKLHTKDVFSFDYARLSLTGKIKGQLEYDFEYDLAATYAGNTDVTNSPVVDANVTYTGNRWANIKIGYQKLPFSLGSMITEKYGAFLGRPEVVRTGFFSRRDVGVLFFKDYFNQTLNIYAGAFSGLGEYSLQGINDKSLNPLIVSRVTLSYPSKVRERDIDVVGVPVPCIRIGVNAMYNKRTSDQLGSHSVGSYTPYTYINGEKYDYGTDLSILYRHFSFQAEVNRFRYQPWDKSVIPVNTPNTTYSTYYLAGGCYAQTTYYSPKLKSSFSARYDNVNANNRLKGDNSSTLSFAYQLFLHDYNSMLRFQYWHRLNDKDMALPLENDQLRIGWQFLF